MKPAKMGLIAKVIAGVFLTVAGIAMAANNRGTTATATPSASGASFSNVNLTSDACAGVSGTLSVTATGTVDDGGGNDIIWFTIFDDGIEKFAQQISIPVGTTTTTVVTVNYPGAIGGSAPGIGLFLGETRDASDLIDDDPFFPTSTGGGIGSCGLAVPATSNWSLTILAGMLGLLGLGVLIRRKRT